MDQQGAARRVRAQEVTQKKSVKDAVALDSQHQHVKVGDVVNVIDGQNKVVRCCQLPIYIFKACVLSFFLLCCFLLCIQLVTC